MRARLHVHRARSRVLLGTVSVVALLFGVAWTSGVSAAASTTTTASTATTSSYTPAARGELDCNGFSPVQKPLRGTFNCTDIRGIPGKGNANSWDGRFYDNGHYIGHDEPDTAFIVQRPRLRQQRELDDHPRPRPDGGARPTPTRAMTSRTGSSSSPRRGSRWPCATPTRSRRRPARPSRTPTPPPASARLAPPISAGARPSWRCSSTRRATRPSWTARAATARTGARPSPSTASRAPPRSRAVTQTAKSRSTSPLSSGTECRPGRRHRRTPTLNTFVNNNQTLLMNPGDKITLPHVRRARTGRW